MRLIDADALIEDLHGSLFYSDAIPFVEDAPTVDAKPIIHCKDCIWWEDEHVLLSDGTKRPYTEEEKKNCPTGVTCDIGINVGSRCMVNPHITSLFRNANDYCSRADMRGEKND